MTVDTWVWSKCKAPSTSLTFSPTADTAWGDETKTSYTAGDIFTSEIRLMIIKLPVAAHKHKADPSEQREAQASRNPVKTHKLSIKLNKDQ